MGESFYMNLKPKNILLVINSLEGGGAEKNMLWLYQQLEMSHNHRPTLLTFKDETYDKFRINKILRRRCCFQHGIPQFYWYQVLTFFLIILKIRKCVKANRPNVVVSFLDQTNILVILATLGLGIKTVVSERCDPRFHALNKRWKILRKLTYPLADRIIVFNEEIKEWLEKELPLKNKIYTIPNAVPVPKVVKNPHYVFSQPTFITVARLSYEKGIDLLILSFVQVLNKLPNAKLKIYGEGPQREHLQDLIKEKGLSKNVSLCGFVNDIQERLLDASIFVFSSRHEGFGQALIEAMSSGLPVISFDCPSGPRNIINKANGILVENGNVTKLAKAMIWLSTNEKKRKSMGKKGLLISDFFSEERVYSLWKKAINA